MIVYNIVKILGTISLLGMSIWYEYLSLPKINRTLMTCIIIAHSLNALFNVDSIIFHKLSNNSKKKPTLSKKELFEKYRYENRWECYDFPIFK